MEQGLFTEELFQNLERHGEVGLQPFMEHDHQDLVVPKDLDLAHPRPTSFDFG